MNNERKRTKEIFELFPSRNRTIVALTHLRFNNFIDDNCTREYIIFIIEHRTQFYLFKFHRYETFMIGKNSRYKWVYSSMKPKIE